jgi:hypothetical protein
MGAGTLERSAMTFGMLSADHPPRCFLSRKDVFGLDVQWTAACSWTGFQLQVSALTTAILQRWNAVYPQNSSLPLVDMTRGLVRYHSQTSE